VHTARPLIAQGLLKSLVRELELVLSMPLLLAIRHVNLIVVKDVKKI
jgi:hypothetical protein